MVKESGEIVGIRFLGETNGDWRRLIGNEILQGSSCDIVVEKSRQIVSVGFLGKSHSDRAWLICNQIFKGSSSDIVIEESGEVVSIGLGFIKLDESSSDWGSLVGDEVLQSRFSNVLTIHLSNDLSD
jgi:hypothetical protein